MSLFLFFLCGRQAENLNVISFEIGKLLFVTLKPSDVDSRRVE